LRLVMVCFGLFSSPCGEE